jgi:putative membrane protein insertion efficiency factor
VIQQLRRLAWLAGAPTRLALVALIRLYRVSLAGLVGGQCRFHPTCSHYAEEAIRELGAIRGVVLSTWRVLRCNPFGKGGSDPVPLRRVGAPMYEAVIQERAA